MHTIELLRCILLLAVSSNLCGQAGSSSLSNEELQFHSLLEQGQQLDLQGHESFIVLIGMSGTGKSTLSRYLVSDPSMKIVMGSGRKCIFMDEAGTVGTQTQTSRTTVPNSVLHPESGQLIVDCPGFGDTRKNPANDIAAALFVKKVFDAAQRIKIVLVENYNSVEFYKSRDAFLKTVSHVANLVPNAKKLVGSFGIVATKVDSSDPDEDIIDSIKEFINDTLYGHLLPQSQAVENGPEFEQIRLQIVREIAVVDALLSSEKNVAIFRIPCKKKVGKSTQCTDCQGSEDLKQMVFSELNFQKSRPSDYTITVTDASKLFIKDTQMNNTETLITQTLDSIVSKERSVVDSYIQSIGLTNNEKISSIEKSRIELQQLLISTSKVNGVLDFIKTHRYWSNSFRNQLDKLSIELEKLRFFHDCLHSDIEPFLSKLGLNHSASWATYSETFETEFKVQDEISSFLKNVGSYNLVKELRHAMKNFLTATLNDSQCSMVVNTLLAHGLPKSTAMVRIKKIKLRRNFCDHISRLVTSSGLTLPLQNNDGTDLIIHGQYIFISDLNIPVTTRAVHIIASRKVFVDKNMHFRDIHVTIMTPEVAVVGTRTFRMTGRDGTNYESAAVSSNDRSTPGADGAAGRPGYSSGSLTIVTQTVENGRFLTLHSSGGNGGDGQNGGDGFSGVEAENKLKHHDVIDCIFQNWGKSCTKFSSEYSVEVNDYIRNVHCIATVTTRNGVPSTNGGNGGNGGPGGLAGKFLISPMQGDNFATVSTDGCDGRPGLGGAIKNSCVTMTNQVKCNLYGGSQCIDTCYEVWRKCADRYFPSTGSKGSTVKAKNFNYYFEEPSINRQNEFNLNIIFHNLMSSLPNNADLLEDIKNALDVHVMLNDLMSPSTIEIFFELVQKISETKLTAKEKSSILNHILKQFRSRKSRFTDEEHWNDLVTLEMLILSSLDLVESSQPRRVILKLKFQLDLFKRDADKIIGNWKDLYEQKILEEHKDTLQKQIESTEHYRKAFVHDKIEEFEKTLKEQFNILVENVKVKKVLVQENTHKLYISRDDIAKNFWKRILFGSLRLVAGMTAIFKPAIGTALQMGVTVAEKLAVQSKTSDIKKVEIPDSVSNIGKLMTKIDKLKMQNSLARKNFQLAVADDALQLEKIMSRSLLSVETRDQLRKAVDNDLDTIELANDNLVKVFEAAHKELGSFDDQQAEVGEMMSALKVAQHVSALSAGVLSDVRKMQRDSAAMNEIEKAIVENEQTMRQLGAYETSLYKDFEPYLASMRGSFNSFTNDAEGMAQHLLIFRKVDLQKMTRQFTSLIRRFTEGFTDEQQELMGVIDDLEATAMSAMNAQTHVNELEYKMQLSKLVSAVSSSKCYGTRLCALTLMAESAVKTNGLLQKYAQLESAYQQTLFPFGGRRRLVELQQGSDTNLTIKILRERVDTMISELDERDATIDAVRDRDLRIAVFNSKYSSSTPFYVWRPEQHSEQIVRFLRGEKVTLVADVRNQKSHNAVKFHRIGLNVTVPGVDLNPLLKYLLLEMTHNGDNHFRCGERHYAIAADPLTFRSSFESDEFGQLVSQNAVATKFSRTDIPYSPYTAWTMQLIPGPHPTSMTKLQQLASHANVTHLELHGSGSYVAEGATVCEKDLTEQFDVFV